ncbi:serine hydrolase [Sphingomonas sp. 28-63-12]|uniref:serine hydrolase n=1 Tax=Sphingomonas sp. 28-63-12 TaxID=1970434 RepID=UPI000BD14AD4|nr:MAG: hypothetical protein B7Y47_11195 [Sphingomonas sp. 28-63-12]
MKLTCWRPAIATAITAAIALSVTPAFARVTEAQRASIAKAMTTALEAERADSGQPSMAAAVFDADGIIWSGTVGSADAAGKRPATPDTVYRAGSVSKLFTDIMIMQLVEKHRIDLDAPVQAYLPEFHPHNPFGAPITIRQLMTHRSGLVREPPVGSYFAKGDPGSAKVVASLNETTLVAAPGTVTKYSNAGIAVLGRVLERVTGRNYDDLVAAMIFRPAGMAHSSFSLAARKGPLAYAEIAEVGGPRTAAPQFDLGLKAAGSLVAPVDDLARFGITLLQDQSGSAKVLRAASLAEMQRPQYAKDGARTFGLGFGLGERGGLKVVGHGGAVYGFTTDFQLVPSAGFGVAVFGTVDSGAAPFRVSGYALKLTKAVLDGAAPPSLPPRGAPVAAAAGRLLEGFYADETGSAALRYIDGHLFVDMPGYGGEIQQRGDRLEIVDFLEGGDDLVIDPQGRFIRDGNRTFTRTEWHEPAAAGADLAKLVGDYGWDHNWIRVHQRDGKPYITIEWYDSAAMTPVDADHWAFGKDSLLYPLETLAFSRDSGGKGASISLNGIVFPRRADSEETPSLTDAERAARIAQVAGARQIALAASPPVETGKFRPSDLIALRAIDPSIALDIRYAGTHNFIGAPVYSAPVAMLQRPAATSLAKVNQLLRSRGYGLIIHDGYRPWYVTKMFWDATPPEGRIFVADPAQGSRHNRGAAVDLSIVHLATGAVVQMPGGYDESSSRSYATYRGGTDHQRWLRDMLRSAMQAGDFDVYPYEWWHFDYRDWRAYPIGNVELQE